MLGHPYEVRLEHLERVGLSGPGIVTISQTDPDEHVPWMYGGRFWNGDPNSNAAANIAWLSKRNFPKLASIRALSPQLLSTYVKQGGRKSVREDTSPGFMALESRTAKEGIRFEDCTGNLFGQPQIETHC